MKSNIVVAAVATLSATTIDVGSVVQANEAPPHTTHICWVEHVTKEALGVRIYFNVGGSFIGGSMDGQDFIVKAGVVRWTSGKKGKENGLLLSPGQKAYLMSGVESTCSVEFAEKEGRKGILANASFSPPGTNQTARDFISADVPATP